MIDLHCHLDLYPDYHTVLDRCRQARVRVLAVTTTPRAWSGTRRLFGDMPHVRFALGLHPQLAHERAMELPLFEAHLAETRYVGEVGLDGSRPFRDHWRIQRRVFDSVLQSCAKAGGRLISIHSRGASEAVLMALTRVPEAGVPVLHWFSGTQAEMRRAVEQGCWFSVGPAMLASNKGRQLVASMPQRKVLTETDGPFAKISGRPLQPPDVILALDALGDLWGTSLETTAAVIDDNFETMWAPLGGSIDALGRFERTGPLPSATSGDASL